MARLKEYQDYKTYQEILRKLVGTIQKLEEDWKPFMSPQVATTLEVSSPCILFVLIRTSQEIKYPKPTPISTTKSPSGGAGGMGSGPDSGLKT
ncbi:hypothetical protein O181_070808 [Austropuccinia psidii MF-1]|uniref:Uncharacterized protein n=1 Tax=Austropuccinia psidii MF-1 TaxID=1389203 RepID=A0A9Q3EZW1_9BASI|nr:hypothetical protein [Austropuccinia psidii MF-1]